ncbi:unnamed protein product [Toxocara canis]|uniref:Uncharacterized protein n=1 Tax=Toxocara canis TaxID=6265 RepID=A0A3P7GPK2_TOXCA|nr:unnamed protein product [Toxocara canis]
MIAPSLRVSLKTETWQHQSGTSKNLFSWCRSPNPYQVFNAKQVTLPFNITFPNYDDHAKYAVATDTQGGFSYPWVCIGGINRQSHQLERGGGVLCTADAQLYAAFSTIISEYWPCRGSEM